MNTTTIAIGLDAADYGLLDQYVAEGAMPALAALRARGATGRLSNAGIYRTETPWTNFLTGTWQEKTGFWGPVRFNPQTYVADEAGAYPFDVYPPFYSRIEGPVGIFDVPQARLQPGHDGLQVLGWGAHAPQGPSCSAPAGLLAELEARYGPSPADSETATNTYDPEALASFDDDVVESLRRRVPLTLDLLAREPWRFFLTVVGETHAGPHELWHHGQAHPLHRPGVDRVRNTYRLADELIAAVDRAAPENANIVVFSLHGMEANALDVPSMAILPEVIARWALDEPLLAAGSQPAPEPRMDYARHWKQEVWDLRTSAGDRALSGPDELMQAGDVLNWQPAQWYRPLWPQMRAFVLPSYDDGTIRFNLRGREANGLVDPDQAGALAAELEQLLSELTDLRSGRPVVDKVVYRPPQVGKHAAPADLFVHWSAAAISDVFHHPRLGVFGPYPWFRTGGHRPTGVWTVAGPGVPQGVPLEAGSVVDLSASLLALAGAAPHPGMDGRSLLAQ